MQHWGFEEKEEEEEEEGAAVVAAAEAAYGRRAIRLKQRGGIRSH